MKNFNYSVTITTRGIHSVCEFNDVREAIRTMLECDIKDAHICIHNGHTGEVLYENGEEPWCTNEMELMILGFMTELAIADDEEDEEEPAEAVEVSKSEAMSAFIAQVIATLGIPYELDNP